MQEYTYITYSVEQRRATIMLNRPDKRNALNGEVVAELTDAFSNAEIDDEVKVVVLGGKGKVFCAGADLAYLQQLQANTLEENLEDSRALKDLFLKIYSLKKVVVARVHGHAIAGGCGLATVCDFVFAVPEAKFGCTEVRIGFIPALVKVFLLRKLGEGWARQLLLSGDLISAAEAHRMGLVQYLKDNDELDAALDSFVTTLIEKNSGMSMSVTKHMIAAIPDMSIEKALDYAARKNAQARESEDCRKGISSFLSKEEIRW